MEDLIIKVNDKEYKVSIESTETGKIRVHYDERVYEVETKAEIKSAVIDDIRKKESIQEKVIITAPLPGIVLDIKVKVGDSVKEGDLLLKLVAMKMENDIIATKNGIIKEIRVKKDDNVNKGDVLVVIE